MKNLTYLIVLLMTFSFGTSVAAPTQERVIVLPQDGGRWFLTIYGDATNVEYQKLQSWLQTHEGLSTLRSQTHYNEYNPTDTRYQRYAASLPGPVCIRLQNSIGLVTSEFWSGNIPSTAVELFKGIRGDLQDKASWGCLNRRRNPAPKPTPTPTPGPAPIDTPPVFVDPEPEEESEEETESEPSFPWLLAAIVAIGGAGLGVGHGFKAEHIDSKRKSAKM